MVIEMNNVKYVITATTYLEGGQTVVHRGKQLESEEIDFLMIQNDIRKADSYSLKKDNKGCVLYSKYMLDRTIFEFITL